MPSVEVEGQVYKWNKDLRAVVTVVFSGPTTDESPDIWIQLCESVEQMEAVYEESYARAAEAFPDEEEEETELFTDVKEFAPMPNVVHTCVRDPALPLSWRAIDNAEDLN